MARKIRAREALRLPESGMSRNAIARSQGMSKHSVQAVSEAAEAAGIGWAEAEGMSDAEVYAALFPEKVRDRDVYPDPDWERVHRELARVGVTLKRLHEEYRDEQRSKGEPFMSYDRFCKRCREFTVRKQVVSRVGHRAGRILEARKYAAFQVLVLDEWLLDRPDELFRGFLLELMGPATARRPPSSAPSSARRTGTPGSAAGSTLTPSWTASSTAPHGSAWAR